MTERMAILLDELERRAQDPDDVYPRNAVERFKLETEHRLETELGLCGGDFFTTHCCVQAEGVGSFPFVNCRHYEVCKRLTEVEQ